MTHTEHQLRLIECLGKILLTTIDAAIMLEEDENERDRMEVDAVQVLKDMTRPRIDYNRQCLDTAVANAKKLLGWK